MTGRLRLIDTGVAPARWNVAATAALAERRAGAGEGADVLRFHRYEPCVLLGRGQRVDEAADLAACRRLGVALARRVTGGGAVFMAPSVLAFDLVLRRPPVTGEELFAQVGTAVAAALATFGPDARCGASGAVLIGGRKACGLSGSFEGPVAALQMSILVDLDRTVLEAVLRLQGTGAAVTSLAEEIGRPPHMDEVQAAVVRALAVMLRAKPVSGELDAAEARLAERLLGEEIGTDAFVMGCEREAAA